MRSCQHVSDYNAWHDIDLWFGFKIRLKIDETVEKTRPPNVLVFVTHMPSAISSLSASSFDLNSE